MEAGIETVAGMGGAPWWAAEPPAVRLMRPDERAEVVETLALGFARDPVLAWMLPDAEARPERSRRAFAVFAHRYYWRGPDAAFVTGDLAGVACWIAPEAVEIGRLAELALMGGLVRSVRGDFRRLARCLGRMDEKHPHEPHWYLPAVAVRPHAQGRGLGHALLQPVLERADADGVPAYLEATTPRNRALYERNGFEVVEEVPLPEGGPPFWAMWRVPR